MHLMRTSCTSHVAEFSVCMKMGLIGAEIDILRTTNMRQRKE
jgi:hypothetical protein